MRLALITISALLFLSCKSQVQPGETKPYTISSNITKEADKHIKKEGDLVLGEMDIKIYEMTG